jgi:PAS domain S-box-containing protein
MPHQPHLDQHAMQESLTILHERLQAVGMSVGILEISPDGFITYANEAVVRQTGFSVEELIGAYHTIFIPADKEHIDKLRMMQRQLLRGEPFVGEVERRCKDGSLVTVLLSCTPARRADGTIRSFICTAIDMSERRAISRELRRSQIIAEALLENALDVITMMTTEGIILYQSPSIGRITGAASEYYVGTSVFEYLHPDDVETFTSSFQQALSTNKSTRVEFRWRTAFGDYVWFENTPLKQFYFPELGCILTSVRHITERRQMEEQLRRERQLLQDAQLVAHIGNWEYDIRTRMLLWSDEVYRILAVPALYVPTIEGYFQLVHPDDRPLLEECIDKAYRFGTPYDIELRHVLFDGSIRYCQARGRVKRDSNGEPLVLYGTLSDIHAIKLKEIALCESQERLAEAEQIGRIGSWEYDLATGATVWSANKFALHGLDATQGAPSESDHRLMIHPDDLRAYTDAWERAIMSNESFTLTLRYRMPDGSYHFFQERGKALVDADGKTLKIRGTTLDVHDLTEQQRALQESELRYRSIVEQSNEIIFTLSLQGELTFVSPSWTTWLGHDINDVVGQHFLNFVHPDDVPEIMEQMARVLSSGASVRNLDYRARHISGEWRWHRHSGALVRNADGVPLYYAGLAQDVTEKLLHHREIQALNVSLERRIAQRTAELEALNQELELQLEQRRRTEEALQNSRQNILAMLENTDDSVWSLDTNYVVTGFNTRFAELVRAMFGKSVAVGDSLHEWIELLQTAGQPWHEWYSRAFSGEQFRVEHRHVRTPDLYHEFSLNPIRDDDGTVMGVVVFARDISERKRAEEEILAALMREKELNTLKTRFVTMVSHEFRTPLTTIRSSAELLRRSRQRLSEEKQQRYFAEVEQAVDMMTHLLDHVLFLGKAGANKITVTRWQTDLVDLFDSIIASMELASISLASSLDSVHDAYNGHDAVLPENAQTTAAAQRIRWHLRVEPLPENQIVQSVPDALLDERLVRQAITNLLSNALKYSPASSPVMMTVVVQTAEPTELVITIADNGIGIPEVDQRLLFEPFHRASNAGEIVGTGLGLAIVREIVELLGGTITCRSIVNEGTTFTVHLPCTFVRRGAEFGTQDSLRSNIRNST